MKQKRKAYRSLFVLTLALGCADEHAYQSESVAEPGESTETLADGIVRSREYTLLDEHGAEQSRVDADGSATSTGLGLVEQALSPCSGLTLTRFPMDGINGRDFVLHNYTDRNPTAGATADYTGVTGALARTYDGHSGLDVAIANFRGMDNQTALARAAAPGVVVTVVQHLFDRETTLPAGCARPPNYIEVDHGNGYRGYYLHLKQNSARVAVGATVTAGQALGVVGSSGCSTGPHLHFELHCGGNVLEPFAPNLWSSSPAYRPSSQALDSVIISNALPSDAQIIDPPVDAASVPPNGGVGIGLSFSGSQGDILHVRVRRPNGLVHASTDWMVDGSARFGYRIAKVGYLVGSDAGFWTASVQLNNGRIISKRFRVN